MVIFILVKEDILKIEDLDIFAVFRLLKSALKWKAVYYKCAS